MSGLISLGELEEVLNSAFQTSSHSMKFHSVCVLGKAIPHLFNSLISINRRCGCGIVTFLSLDQMVSIDTL